MGDIRTGVDRLLALVKEKKKITMDQAARELQVENDVIQDWAEFLRDEGVIDLKYGLLHTTIEEHELSPAEFAEKSRVIEGQRETFLNKVNSTINALDEETASFTKFKKEFEDAIKQYGAKIDDIQKEFQEIERLESVKSQIAILEKEHDAYHEKEQAMESSLKEQYARYNELAGTITEHENQLAAQRARIAEILSTESSLRANLEQDEKLLAQLRAEFASASGTTVPMPPSPQFTSHPSLPSLPPLTTISAHAASASNNSAPKNLPPLPALHPLPPAPAPLVAPATLTSPSGGAHKLPPLPALTPLPALSPSNLPPLPELPTMQTKSVGASHPTLAPLPPLAPVLAVNPLPPLPALPSFAPPPHLPSAPSVAATEHARSLPPLPPLSPTIKHEEITAHTSELNEDSSAFKPSLPPLPSLTSSPSHSSVHVTQPSTHHTVHMPHTPVQVQPTHMEMPPHKAAAHAAHSVSSQDPFTFPDELPPTLGVDAFDIDAAPKSLPETHEEAQVVPHGHVLQEKRTVGEHTATVVEEEAEPMFLPIEEFDSMLGMLASTKHQVNALEHHHHESLGVVEARKRESLKHIEKTVSALEDDLLLMHEKVFHVMVPKKVQHHSRVSAHRASR